MRRSSYLARSTQKDPKEIYFIFFLNFILFSMNFVSLIGFLQNFKRQTNSGRDKTVHSNGKRTGPRLALTDRQPLVLSWPLMLTDCLGKRPGRPMHARARHGHLAQRAGSGTTHSSLGAVVLVGKT
jgi:hypothetical protein